MATCSAPSLCKYFSDSIY